LSSTLKTELLSRTIPRIFGNNPPQQHQLNRNGTSCYCRCKLHRIFISICGCFPFSALSLAKIIHSLIEVSLYKTLFNPPHHRNESLISKSRSFVMLLYQRFIIDFKISTQSLFKSLDSASQIIFNSK